MDYQNEALEDRSESSYTVAGRVGTYYHWLNGLNGQVNLRVAHRHFAQAHVLLDKIRNDREYLGSVALWHDKINYKGITPKLVYQYRKINSNIPALYSWQSRGFNVEMVKWF